MGELEDYGTRLQNGVIRLIARALNKEKAVNSLVPLLELEYDVSSTVQEEIVKQGTEMIPFLIKASNNPRNLPVRREIESVIYAIDENHLFSTDDLGCVEKSIRTPGQSGAETFRNLIHLRAPTNQVKAR